MNVEVNHRMWELYASDCEQNGIQPRISDFVQWLDENYPDWIDDEA